MLCGLRPAADFCRETVPLLGESGETVASFLPLGLEGGEVNHAGLVCAYQALVLLLGMRDLIGDQLKGGFFVVEPALPSELSMEVIEYGTWRP